MRRSCTRELTFENAGGVVNLRSAAAVAALLYQTLGLPMPASCSWRQARAVALMCSTKAISALGATSATPSTSALTILPSVHPPSASSDDLAAAGGRDSGDAVGPGGAAGAAGGGGAGGGGNIRGVECARLVSEHRKLSALLNCHVLSLLSFCRAKAGGGAGSGVGERGHEDMDVAKKVMGADGSAGEVVGEKGVKEAVVDDEEELCRVHPSQMHMGSATGRIGTRNPNIQAHILKSTPYSDFF
jgi:hypothetical protein